MQWTKVCTGASFTFFFFFILDWKSISKATNHLPEQEKSCWESLQNKRTKICKICGPRIQDSKRGMFGEIYAETLLLNIIKVLCLFNQPTLDFFYKQLYSIL